MARVSRRGSYAALYSGALFLMLAFGAMALDLALIRLAQSQDQDVADAASQAALLTLRATGNQQTAREVAQLAVSHNTVVGLTPDLQLIEFGQWQNGMFAPGDDPNGVRVWVGRPIPLALARLFGHTSMPVKKTSISAARPLHVILVMDITNSWSQANFAFARQAAVKFYDTVSSTAGPDDRVGMVVFTGRYGVEHTPMLTFAQADAAGVRANWNILRTASKAGTPSTNANGCNVYSGANLNNFAVPVNGCFPHMWREYIDESGTDHTTGMDMARIMFEEQNNPAVYRAMVLLTDGAPNGTGAHNQRNSAAYVEGRWRSFRTVVPRTTNMVIADSQTKASALWNDLEVHSWAVSFVANATWLNGVKQGDGYYVNTSSSSALVDIFADVAESLPVAIVQ